jgi:hypothetical protein
MVADGHSVEKLRGYLQELKPEARALLLAELERKRSHGDGLPGVDLVLQELRSEHARDGQPRGEMPDPSRDVAGPENSTHEHRFDDPAGKFFAFFEPFVVDDDPEYEHPGRIARSSVKPIWDWICRDLATREAEEYFQAFARAAGSGDRAAIDQVARAFQDCASKSIDQAIAATGSDDRLRRRLIAQIGTPRGLHDAHLVASLLKSRDLLHGIAARIPQSIRNFADDQLEIVKSLLDAVSGRNKALFVLALVLVRSKLGLPWQLIRLATRAADSDVATRVSETPYSVAVNIVLTDVERLIRRLTSDLKRGQAGELGALLKEIHDAARGLRTEMDLSVDSPWARRLSSARAEIATLLKDHVESMPSRVRRLLRPRQGKEVAPVSRLDESDVEETEALIGLVGICRIYAGELAINEMTLRAYSELQHYLEANTQTLIDGLRTAKPAERDLRQSQVEAAVRFCAKVFGQEYATLLTKAADVAANSERKAATARA